MDRRDALERAVELASRLRRSEDHGTRRPVGAGVAHGWAGLAWTAAAFERHDPDGAWAEAGHAWLGRAVAELEQETAPAVGFHHGVAGVAAATTLLGGGARYATLRSRLEGVLLTATSDLCNSCRNARGREALPVGLADGLAGVGRYWILAAPSPEADAAIGHVVAALQDLADRNDGLLLARSPLDHTPPAVAASAPGGVWNLGMPVGVAGLLAMASVLADLRPEGAKVRSAVAATAAWLAGQCVPGVEGPRWPKWVPVGGGDDLPHQPLSDRWCYGTPGVARALWLAGTAVGAPDLVALSLAAMRGVARRGPAGWNTVGPGVCHGQGSVVAVLARFAHESGDEELWAATRRAAGELVRDRAGCDRPDMSLMEGAAGTALCLLSVAGPDPWDRFLLLS